MIRATTVTRNDSAPADTVTLGYDDRYRRRMVMTGDGGTAFLLDLAEATELKGGDRLVLEDGREVAVRAKDEALMEAISPDPLHLARTAWHVGNRHLPCELHVDRLILRHDHVIAEMLAHLGSEVRIITGPFQPEGGAYGVGRTHGHSH